MSQFVKLTNRQIDKSATFSSFHCKIDKFINDIERIYHQYRKSIDTLKKILLPNQQPKQQNFANNAIFPKSANWQIGKSPHRQIGKLTNLLVC